MKSDPEKNIPVPDYEQGCVNCGHSPTVTIVNEEGQLLHDLNLCGACCWGEAACLDPDNW